MATKTQEYLKALAGQRALPEDVCCTTLTQDLIIDATERVNALDAEIQQMKSNPDVFDIVGTYTELQNYNTSILTDKDIIRVLSDSTHDGYSTYYRWDAATSQFTYIGKVDDFVLEEFTFTLVDNTAVTKKIAVYDQGA